MIIVDTNVASEPTKPDPSPIVLAWLIQQPVETLYFTAVSLSELLLGVEIMPEGKRKRERSAHIQNIVSGFFDQRILAFDQAAAIAQASLTARAKTAGKVIAFADGQIAAIAHVHSFAVATRDVSPFLAAGVPVINPWEE